jgi:hypothetical protein
MGFSKMEFSPGNVHVVDHAFDAFTRRRTGYVLVQTFKTKTYVSALAGFSS